MKSAMIKDYASIPSSKLPRSRFNRSWDLKTTFDAGYLIPVGCDLLYPGDTIDLGASAVVRLSTPIYPIMDNLFVDLHAFFVPGRLLWTNWEKFMGEREDPADTISSYTIPVLTRSASTDFATGSVFDYMGLPPDVNTSIAISALPFRAYNLIYNEWFRDQTIQDTVTVNVDNGGDALTDYTLLRRNKRHDYFTSCLPWPQRTSAVSMPLGTTAPVIGIGHYTTATYSTGPSSDVRESDGGVANYAKYTGTGSFPLIWEESSTTGYPNIQADLSAASGISINDLRDYITLQQFAELDARGGTRYTEIIRSHFDVVSSDARLQRPEYLGSITNRVGVEAVATTGGNDTNARAVGDLGATSYSVFGDKTLCSYAAEEHGYLIILASTRADLTYSQGVDRLFTDSVREDFYWPTFANLSEQPVYEQEIYAKADGTPTTVFGYQERYAHLRQKKSELSGLMRVDASGTLSAWHLSQDFDNTVALDNTFIQENPPISRVVAVNTEPDFIANFYFDYYCERSMPMYSVPGLERI